jgi:hypothetical protein
MKRMTYPNPAMELRKALGLSSQASSSDVATAVCKLLDPASNAEPADAIRKKNEAAAFERRLQAAERALKREAEAKTVTNAGLSYMKASAAAIHEQRVRDLENDPAVKAELKNLRSSDIRRATLEPRFTEIVEVTDETAAATTRTAYQQLKELARRQRSSTMSEAQSFERVYMDPANRKLVEQDIEERSAMRSVSIPRPPS